MRKSPIFRPWARTLSRLAGLFVGTVTLKGSDLVGMAVFERRTRLKDTSPAAAALQTSIHRRLTGADRLRLALEMSIAARELALTRLRRQHPDWSESDLKRELLRYAFLSTPLPPPLR